MAKNRKKPSWKDAVDASRGGDNDSFMWAAPKDEWQAITLDLQSMQTEDPDKEDGGIHQYKWLTVELEHPESMGGTVREEVPFWAKKQLFAFLDDINDEVDDDGVLDCWYRRVKSDKGNQGEFRFGK